MARAHNGDFMSAFIHTDANGRRVFTDPKTGDTRFLDDGPAPAKPDPNWTPDPSTANSDPWDIYKGSIPPLPDPPKVPGGVDNPGKDVKVINVDAVKYYGNSLREMIPVIKGAITELDDLNSFEPGYFGVAMDFKAKVFGAGSSSGGDGTTLIASTRQVFVEAQMIVEEVAARCDDIVRKYKTADQLSKLDADDFTQMVSNVQSKVSGMTLGSAS
ncbi:hypothetical protein AB0E59_42355 [Lentzea sp. NPDC034063]|uniref:hypothetical protein n=1 Tax=unclassified Lentzea TaxID=2643253 RepID=UPI0033F7429A